MLQINNVNTHYGPIQALHDVSVEVKQGEIVTLIGANGAGKTTLMMTICGHPQATSGEILFDGKPITGQPTSQIMRQGLAIVPEGRRVFARLTVQENLHMGAYFRTRAQYEETLEEVLLLFPRLRERFAQRAGTMSGGEQQMLAIGRAMMSKPRMILLDEPSLGLAPIIIQQIFQIIEKLRDDGDVLAHDGGGIQAAQILTFEQHPPLSGPGFAADGHHQGGLAGAVGADQGDDLPLLYFDGDIFQRLDLAIAGTNIIHMQHAQASPR